MLKLWAQQNSEIVYSIIVRDSAFFYYTKECLDVLKVAFFDRFSFVPHTAGFFKDHALSHFPDNAALTVYFLSKDLKNLHMMMWIVKITTLNVQAYQTYCLTCRRTLLLIIKAVLCTTQLAVMEYDYKVTMISVSRVFYKIFQTAGIPLTVSQSSAFPTLIAIAFILLFFTDKNGVWLCSQRQKTVGSWTLLFPFS